MEPRLTKPIPVCPTTTVTYGRRRRMHHHHTKSQNIPNIHYYIEGGIKTKMIYIKYHPSSVCIIFDNNEYCIIPLTRNLITSSLLVEDELKKMPDTTEIVIEKCYLRLDNPKLTIGVQRGYGVLLYLIHKRYPTAFIDHVSSKDARLHIYGTTKLAKHKMISEAQALLASSASSTPLQPLMLMNLFDCLVLKAYKNKGL